MKPQLVMMDPGGEHNRDLRATEDRLTKKGAWKKQRVVMIMPAADTIAAKVALNLMGLAFPPNQQMTRILALGMEVGEAYSQAIAGVLANAELSQWEYILTVEHDNLVPGDGVIRLCEQMEAHPELACIGGLYFTKSWGGVAQIWGDPKDPTINFRPQPPRADGGLVECCGTGMGFNLFRMSMFKDKKLRQPWFKTQTVGGVSTQDLYFWSDARKHGYRCAIDCSVKVGHYDLTGAFGIPDFTW